MLTDVSMRTEKKIRTRFDIALNTICRLQKEGNVVFPHE